MRKLLLAVLAAATLSIPSPLATQAASCAYVLGFATLHDMAPADIGDCQDNQYLGNPNGDQWQDTAKGLMVWRKADNWTAFTNGYATWLNSPFGLVQRLNTERFTFEADYGAPGLIGAVAPGQIICRDRFPWPSPTRQGACSDHGGITTSR